MGRGLLLNPKRPPRASQMATILQKPLSKTGTDQLMGTKPSSTATTAR